MTQGNNKSIDQIFAEICSKYSVHYMGGSSGDGWSKTSTAQRCLRLFNYKENASEGSIFTDPDPLTIGATVHFLLALYYYRRDLDPDHSLSSTELLEEMRKGYRGRTKARLTAIADESERLFRAYLMAYHEADPLKALAVERRAEIRVEEVPQSCRFDLIAKVEKGYNPPGVYIIEHKTSARFTYAFMNQWPNHGEIIGQQKIFIEAGLEKLFGPLRGTIINIIGKQKNCKFERRLVPRLPDRSLRDHARDLVMLSDKIVEARASGYWPRSRANCVDQWGRICEYFLDCTEDTNKC